MKADEKVLCVPRAALPGRWLGQRTALRLSWGGCLHVLEKAGGRFVPRSMAEDDSTHKQIIPYVVVCAPEEGLVGCYRRKGSEERLHGFESVGIGGHVGEEDRREGENGIREAVLGGLSRELSEEFRVAPQGASPAFLGVINEELSAVGKVHLGLVFRMEAHEPDRVIAGPELLGFQWIGVDEAASRNLELWSRLALELL